MRHMFDTRLQFATWGMMGWLRKGAIDHGGAGAGYEAVPGS